MTIASSCGICQLEEPAHATLNHEFSREGRLIPKEAPKKPEKTKPGNDFALRMLLLSKGIITTEELTATERMIHEQLAARPDSSFGGITR